MPNHAPPTAAELREWQEASDKATSVPPVVAISEGNYAWLRDAEGAYLNCPSGMNPTDAELYALSRTALPRCIAEIRRLRERQQWTKIEDAHPPRGRQLVRRGRYMFTASPCYGMHNPWWVPLAGEQETDPIDMLKDDEWMPLPPPPPPTETPKGEGT